MFHPPAAYHEFSPSPDLAPYVKCYSFLEYRLPSNVIVTDYFLPYGCPYMSIIYCGYMWADYSQFQRSDFSNNHIAGQLLHHHYAHHTGNLKLVGIFFQPSGFSHLFNLPMNELTQDNIDVEDFFGSQGKILISEIVSSDTNQQRVKIIENLLRRRLKSKHRKYNYTDWAVRLIQQDPLQSIDRVCDDLNVSSRHLRRLFKEKVGIGPKYYSRICRFHRVLQLSHQQPQIDLQEFSFQCGYYDHSHFIKDFKQFSGKSPYDYLINNNRNLEVGGFL